MRRREGGLRSFLDFFAAEEEVGFVDDEGGVGVDVNADADGEGPDSAVGVTDPGVPVREDFERERSTQGLSGGS